MAWREIKVVQGSRAWHQSRNAFSLTSSDFAAAIGASRYLSRRRLWEYKKNLRNRERDITDYGRRAMQYGREMESVARESLQVTLESLPSFENCRVETCGMWAYPWDPRIAASPDGKIVDAAGNVKGVVEIKCPYQKKLYPSLEEDELPIEHFVQVMGQIACSVQTWCLYCVYIPNEPLHIWRVHFNPEAWAFIYGRVCEFLCFTTRPPKSALRETRELLTEFQSDG